MDALSKAEGLVLRQEGERGGGGKSPRQRRGNTKNKCPVLSGLWEV